jgi:hypothetical protein
MQNQNLSRLEAVDPRKVWKNEAADFTPWLAHEDNIKLLGDTLFLDLELVSQEKSIGPYRADIVCRDTTDNSMVLIENQLNVSEDGCRPQVQDALVGDQNLILYFYFKISKDHPQTHPVFVGGTWRVKALDLSEM